MEAKNKLLAYAKELYMILEFPEAIVSHMKEIENKGKKITVQAWKEIVNTLSMNKKHKQKALDDIVLGLERLDRLTDVENRLKKLEDIHDLENVKQLKDF